MRKLGFVFIICLFSVVSCSIDDEIASPQPENVELHATGDEDDYEGAPGDKEQGIDDGTGNDDGTGTGD